MDDRFVVFGPDLSIGVGGRIEWMQSPYTVVRYWADLNAFIHLDLEWPDRKHEVLPSNWDLVT